MATDFESHLSTEIVLEGCSASTVQAMQSDQQARLLIVMLGTATLLMTYMISHIMRGNKNLQQHPNQLVLYMILLEAAGCWNACISLLGVDTTSCYFGLHYIAHATFLRDTDYQTILNLLADWNMFFVQFFQFCALGLSFCICLDVILTLKAPFEPASRRGKWYVTFSVIVAIILSLCTQRNLHQRESWAALSELGEGTVTCLVIQLYVLMAACSSAYATSMMKRPGMDRAVRKRFIKNHNWQIGIYTLTWLFYLAQAYYIIFVCSFTGGKFTLSELQAGSTSDDNFANQLEFLMYCSLTSAMMTGLFMSLVRLQEPKVRSTIKIFLYQCFGVFYEDTNEDPTSGTLVQFLTASVTVELVHLILKTVSEYTVGTAKSSKNFRVYQSYDFVNKNNFTLDCIEIENPENWTVNTPKNNNYQSIDIKGANLGPGSQSLTMDEKKVLVINEDMVVTEYAPDVFAFLRNMDFPSGEEYDAEQIFKKSLNPEDNKEMVFKAGESQGKSGSFFFFSKDMKFIIKSMTDSDFEAFMRIFRFYFREVNTRQDSLLARIYGIYSIQMGQLNPVKIIVMGNSKFAQNKLVNGVFDLKGSMVNRFVPDAQNMKSTTTLKDINLLQSLKYNNWLRFRDEDQIAIARTLKADVNILRQLNLMDYSLLLCIENNPDYVEGLNNGTIESRGQSVANVNSISFVSDGTLNSLNSTDKEKLEIMFEDKKTRHKFLSKDCKYIYHLGIIDYLQDFNIEKKLEYYAKSSYNKKDAEISAVHPDRYSVRFLNFMEDKVIIDQKAASRASLITKKTIVLGIN